MEHSFDIVSEINTQELTNAIDQTRRELSVRYDFKGINTEIKQEETQLVILTADEYKLKAVRDILESKLLKRGLDLKILGDSKNEYASGGQIRSVIPLVAGISADKAKIINKLIREQFPKIRTTVQGETIRVAGKNLDELQAVIQLLKNSDKIGIPLQFINYR
ncbi:YajQ family cyclic di-GMP-binding protein [candidate division Kazan bacterium]|uniref:Nucleotide-binding protein DRH29_01005 n=1 Tax=candidate division Kazan bacterium TaxID=2202143 RepID=A0A420ZDP4_UNCK3|nr:MAG: YajQ family cyclic di-GMP-binding protein [candidate division Kazan bacterium]